MIEVKPCLGFARDFLFAFQWYASTFCWFLLQAIFIKERKQCTREVPKPNESGGFYDWPSLMIEIKLCDGLLALQTFRICTCPAIKSRCPLWRFLHPTVCHRSVIVNRNSQLLLLKPIQYSIYILANMFASGSKFPWPSRMGVHVQQSNQDVHCDIVVEYIKLRFSSV